MRRILGPLLALAFAASLAESPIEATFRLHSPDLPDDATVYLSGGAEALGGWRPDGVAMTHAGDKTWTVTLSLPHPMSVEYKYTLGDWEHEGARATGYPLDNFAARLDDGSVIEDSIFFWTSGPREFEIRGQVTGTLEHHREMTGDGLLPRDLVVWLPPGYASEPDRRYAVVYLHDGQNLFDPRTSSFGVDWSVDEALDRLIREGVIEPMIAVGLTSTANRRAEYSPGPAGQAYMDFLVNRVKPMIDATYRTLPDRAHTFVGGSSMGGLISCMLGWQFPEVFGAVMCISPAFWIDGVADWMGFFTDSSAERREVFFYLDNGGIGLDERLQPGIDRMLAFLAHRGYAEGKDYVFVQDPDAVHNEAAWADRFPEALLRCLRH